MIKCSYCKFEFPEDDLGLYIFQSKQDTYICDGCMDDNDMLTCSFCGQVEYAEALRNIKINNCIYYYHPEEKDKLYELIKMLM